MAELARGLSGCGLDIRHVLAGLKWGKMREICKAADLVVINGEGALHHDRPAVADVIALAKWRSELGKPTVLLNTSWFENAPDRGRDLGAFSLVAVRESVSARKISGDGGPSPLLVPDLAIAYAARSGLRHSGGGCVMVSDSTKPTLTKELRKLAAARGWEYLPVLAFPEVQRPGEKSQKIFRRARIARCLGPLAPVLLGTRYHAHAVGVAETREYLRRLAASGGVVTGRFHTVCFAMAMGVPFVAVASNTAKIEAIVKDAGLDPGKRVLAREMLGRLDGVPPYDAEESDALKEFAHRALAGADAMFARVAKLGGVRCAGGPLDSADG